MKNFQIQTVLGRISVTYRKKLPNETKREAEKAQIQRLLKENKIQSSDLTYGEKGNPFLKNSDKFLSISHSDDWYAIYLGNSQLGIDIQTTHPKITKATSYFCNEAERHFTSLHDLHLLWCAKEAIFKKYAGEMTDLAQEVTISQISPTQNSIQASYQNQTELLEYKMIGEVFLVWTVGEQKND